MVSGLQTNPRNPGGRDQENPGEKFSIQTAVLKQQKSPQDFISSNKSRE
jgi:hypothetical protein